MRAALLICLTVALAGVSSASAQGALRGEVAFAAPPANATATAPACAKPCYVVGDRYPYRTCEAECDPNTCSQNSNVWASKDLCCAPGVAFAEGCSQRPAECWVVESFNLRTCTRDDRKCLQGYGVFANEATCCAPGAAFTDGCNANLTISATPCWVVDSYYPSRTCRATRTACDSRGKTFANREACCAPGSGAFGEGCSTYIPSAPCFVIDSYDPVRRCRLENDIAKCSRGWGVFQSQEVCCAPGAAFREGCSPPPAASPAPAVTATAPAATAAPATAPAAPAAPGAAPAASG